MVEVEEYFKRLQTALGKKNAQGSAAVILAEEDAAAD